MTTTSTTTTNNNNNNSAIENERSKASFLFREAVHPGVNIEMELKTIMTSTESEYQHVSVIETSFGKTLITDGKTQSAQIDEFVYHESLVHPAFVKAGLNDDDITTGRPPKKVFIGGGGELATAREVLRHHSVEKLVMVDLDGTVIDVCKKYLPEWGGEDVASNSRLELIIGDAYEYLMNCTEKFDIIIMDISDPIEAGPGIMLYTMEFYQHVKSLLNEHGVFVTQAGSADSVSLLDIEPGSEGDATCFAPIQNTLNEVFNCVLPYTVNIPSFGTDWGFVMAYDSTTKESKEQFITIESGKVDKYLIENIAKSKGYETGDEVLGYYDGESHRRMFSLPKPVRVKLCKDKRIMTKDNPVFMF